MHLEKLEPEVVADTATVARPAAELWPAPLLYGSLGSRLLINVTQIASLSRGGKKIASDIRARCLLC